MSQTTETRAAWTEEDSQRYRELALVAVPARAEQVATIAALLPYTPQDSFRIVDIGCGEGVLTYALLDCFPHASAIALDGSPSMIAHASTVLRGFGSRISVWPFTLTAWEWLGHIDTADCVISSLCLHHLSAEEKRFLFQEVSRRLSDRGALIIADLVEPQRPEARALFASAWDRLVQTQSERQTGSMQLLDRFVAEQWNYYRFPDSLDRPSPLFEQLTWLKEAGFAVVDCFWLQAGHAIYGGYKTRQGVLTQSLPFTAALHAAQAALRAPE